MNDEIKRAIEQVKQELEGLQVSLSDAKAERKAVRQAINGANTITQVIESYHGIEWADEIGSEDSQKIAATLVRREAWLDREIARYKDAVKARTASLTKYEIAAAEQEPGNE